MASPDNVSNEKTYRFITDPGHKENLSGRVRAACVTCRRKKTKCDGEVPCGPCRQHGVICEGFTERKRPKKNTERQTRTNSTRGERRSSHERRPNNERIALSTNNSFDSSTKEVNGSEQRLRRPTAHLQELGAHYSNDSGYASGLQSRHDNPKVQSLQLDTRFPVDYTFGEPAVSSSTYTSEFSPLTVEQQDWSSVKRGVSLDFTTIEPGESDFSQSAALSSIGAPTSSMEWPQPLDSSNLWDHVNSGTQSACKFPTTAQVLEDQAEFLRRLASKQPVVADESSQQTTEFSIYSGSPPDYSTQISPSLQNDSTLALGDRIVGNGLDPLTHDFAPWWEVGPELTPSVGYQQPISVQRDDHMSDAANVDAADATWHLGSEFYNVQPSGLIAGQRSNTSTMPNNTNASRNYRAQSQGSYGQLYAWPE